MIDETEALSLAAVLPWSRSIDSCREAAFHIRRLVAEVEALRTELTEQTRIVRNAALEEAAAGVCEQVVRELLEAESNKGLIKIAVGLCDAIRAMKEQT